MRHVFILMSLLLIFFGLALCLNQNLSLADTEAQIVFALRESPPAPNSPQEYLRHLRASLTETLKLAPSEGLTWLFWDAWLDSFGTSVFSLRLPLLALSLLSAALSYRLALFLKKRFHVQHIGRYGLLSLVLVAHLALPTYQALTRPNWQALTAGLSQERQAIEPLLFAIVPDSALAYHLHASGLSKGIALNLAWRPFAEHEIQAYLESLANQPSLWIIAEENSILEQSALSFLIQTYQITSEQDYTGIVFYRFAKKL